MSEIKMCRYMRVCHRYLKGKPALKWEFVDYCNIRNASRVPGLCSALTCVTFRSLFKKLSNLVFRAKFNASPRTSLHLDCGISHFKVMLLYLGMFAFVFIFQSTCAMFILSLFCIFMFQFVF